MAKDAEIKLTLDTKELLSEAQKVGPALEKALSVKGAIPGIEKLQKGLQQAATDAKIINEKTGNLKSVFNSAQLDKDNKSLEKAIDYATRLQQVNARLQELGAPNGTKDLPSMRGKIGAAAKSGDAEKTNTAKANYEEAKRLSGEQAVLQNQLNQEEATVTKIHDKYSSLVEVATAQADAITRINDEYSKIEGSLNNEANTQNQVNQSVDDTVDKLKQQAEATKEAEDAAKQLAAAQAQTSGAKDGGSATPKAKDTTPESSGTHGAPASDTGLGDIAGSADTSKKSIVELLIVLAQLKSQLDEINGEGAKTKAVFTSLSGVAQSFKELKAAKADADTASDPAKMASAYGNVVVSILRVKQAITDYKQKVKESSNDHQKAERSGTKFAKNTGSAIKSMGTGMKAISKLVGTIRSGFSGLSKMGDKVKSSFSGMASNMKANFKHMLTNITKYVFGFRSLFFLVRRLRKGLAEGIKNVVRYEKSIKALKDIKIDGIQYKSVNQSINQLRSSLLYLKNAWAAAFAPIITVVTPMLTALMNAVADAGNYIAQFVGALTGQKVVLNAAKVSAGDYSKGIDKVKDEEDGAAKSAKKLNDRLADFDDLHVLGKDDDNGGSGSGNGGGNNNNNTGPNPNNMFYFVPGENSLADMIKDAWERANFMELGELLKDKIIDALDNIDWDALKSTLVKIGDSIGSFLQGILGDPKLFEKVGESIGNTLNALSDGIEAFLSHTKKIDLGGNLAKGLNKFFATRDFLKVGKNVGSVIKQILDNIKSFVDTLDSDAVIKAIKDFIEGVNIPEVVGKVGELTLSVGKLIVNVVSGLVVDLSKALADNLYEVTTKGYKTTVNNVEVVLKPGVTADEDAWSAAVEAALTRLGDTITFPTLFSVGQLFNLNDTEVIQAGMIGLQSSLWDLYDAWSAVAKSIPGFRDVFTQWEKVSGTDEKRKKYREYELNWYKEHEAALKTGVLSEVIYGEKSVTEYKKQLEEKKKSLTGYEKEIEDILAKYPEHQRERYRQAVTDQVMKSKEEQLKQIKAMQNNVSTSAKMAWESYQRSAKTAMDNTNSEVKTGTETTSKTVDTNLKAGSTAAQQAWESYQRTAKTSVDTTNETVKTGTETTSTTVKTNLLASSTAAQSAWESYQRSAKDAMDNTNETVKTGTETTSTTIDTNSKPWCTAAQQAWEAYQRSSQTAMDTTNKTVDTGTNSMAQTVDTNVQKIPGSVETAWKDVNAATKENIPKVEETGKTGGTDIGSSIIEGLTAGIISLQPELTQALDNTNSTITTKVGEAKTTTSTATKEIETNISTTLTNINNDAFPKLDALKSKFIEIFNGIKDGIKTPINGVISLTESLVNKVIEGVNGLVKKLNDIPDIKFTNPETNKEYKFGFKIPTLSKVSIPKLAQGAVIPPNKAFMAMLGDQSHGTNIEAPLDTIKQAVAEVLANNGNAEVIRLLQQLIGVVESKSLVIGDKEIGRANARYTNQQRIIRGTSF